MSDQCVTCGRNKSFHTFKEVDECKKQQGKEITTLRVRKNTRDLLAKICTKQMTFDDIIIQLLNNYDEENHDK